MLSLRSFFTFMKEVPALAQIPEIYPAHASRPFVRPHGSGIVFSAVFPRGMECGLQLIHTPDGETLYIPFTDEFRVGRVCSAMITPLDSKEWMSAGAGALALLRVQKSKALMTSFRP